MNDANTISTTKRVIFTDIDPVAIRHPLDQIATDQLKKLRGFDILVAKYLEFRFERLNYVLNTACDVKVAPSSCHASTKCCVKAAPCLICRNPISTSANHQWSTPLRLDIPNLPSSCIQGCWSSWMTKR